jgi:hypothetical protein
MSACWYFPWQKSGLTDYHSIPTEKALDSDLEIFVREVLQNANDQGLDNDDPVEVRFRFHEVDGEVDTFLEQLDWREGLCPHIEGATENEQARDPGLKRFLDHFDGERLLVLTIEDRNTTGLVGGETDNDQPFGALVKDFGGTEKPSSSSGGSHGVGKTVLWAFSGLSTVLFNSVPHRSDFDDAGTPPRLVGRSILPAHEHEDENKTYANHGWFGSDDPSRIDNIGRPASMWAGDGSERLAEALCVDRDTSEPGTTIGVLGFRVPGESLDPDVSEIADQIRAASAKHFWPAMVRDNLEVFVGTPDESEDTRIEWDDAPGVEPFVRCFERQFDADFGELDGPGTTARTDIELTVPRENDEVVDAPQDPVETECDLLVRQLDPSDTRVFERSTDDDLAPNRVARLRGAEMVVDYVSMDRAASRGPDFAAVLVCGEARTHPGEAASSEHRAAEQFLRRSEPTQHDGWVGSKNDYLKKHYTGTIVKEVAALRGDRLEAALRDVVEQEVESGDEVSGVPDLIPVMDGYSGSDSESTGSPLEWVRRPTSSFTGSHWEFEAEGRPKEDHGEWQLKVELLERDGDGRIADRLDVEGFTTVTPSVEQSVDGGVGILEMAPHVDTVRFRGRSTSILDSSADLAEAFETGVVTDTEVDVDATIDPPKSAETDGGGDP